MDIKTVEELRKEQNEKYLNADDWEWSDFQELLNKVLEIK